MSYEGFLSFGGAEILNAGRTATYVNNLLPQFGLASCAECDDLRHALGHEEYTSPFVDQPDWFDENNPDSWRFYGLYPVEINGLDDSVRESAVTQLAVDGAVMSAPRQQGREIRVSALLIGADDAAVQYGITWLRYATFGAACREGEGCTGDHLCYFAACPPICEDSPDVTHDGNGMPRVHNFRTCDEGIITNYERACALPYERNLYQVTVIDGPRVVEQYNPVCGAMIRVEFTMVAGVPWAYSTATFVDESATGDPSTIIPEISCAAGSTSVVRRNLATNPIPAGTPGTAGWASADTARWSVAQDTTVIRLPGDASARMEVLDNTAQPNLATNPIPTGNLNGWKYILGEGPGFAARTNWSRNPAAATGLTGNNVTNFSGYTPGTGETGVTMLTGNSPTPGIIRTNNATVPRAVAGSSRWNYQASGGETGTSTYVTGATDGPVLADGSTITEYARRDITAPKTTGNTGWYYRSLAGEQVLAQGQVWTASMYVRSSHAVRVRAVLTPRMGTTSGVASSTEYITIEPGEWTRLELTAAGVGEATGADGFQIWPATEPSSVLPAGATLDATGVISEIGSHTGEPYFDGDTATTDDLPTDRRFTHQWTGTVNASKSTQGLTISPAPYHLPEGGPATFARRVVTSPKTGASTGWQAQSATYRGNLAGAVGDQVTASVWLRYVGPSPIRIRMRTQTYDNVGGGQSNGFTDSDFITLPSGQWVRVSATHTAIAAFATVGWWAYLTGGAADQTLPAGSVLDATGALIESGGLRTYFDGSFPDTGSAIYAWTGTANASTSTMSANMPSTTTTLQTGAGPNGVNGFMRNQIVVPKTGGYSGPSYTQAVTVPATGAPFTAQVWIRSTVGGAAPLRVQALNATGTVLADAVSAPVNVVPNTWTLFGPVTIEAPAGTTQIRVWAQTNDVQILPAGAAVDMAQVDLVAGWSMFSPVMAHLRFAGQHNLTRVIALMPTVVYTASIYVATTRTAFARVDVTFYNASGGIIGRADGPSEHVAGQFQPTSAGMWSRVDHTFTAPVGTATATFEVYVTREPTGYAEVGDRTYFTNMLIERSSIAQAYFDGSFADTPSLNYAWAGTANASISTVAQIIPVEPGPILDPDCAVVPAPPRPPALEIACLDTPSAWRRYTALIPDDVVPVWRDAVPIVDIQTQATAARQVRVRFYPNPFANPAETLDPCDFCGEFVISYIPPYSVLTIDGIRQQAFVTGPTGAVQVANHLLYASDGGPMQWPLLSCGVTYTAVVDVAPEGVADLSAKLCVAARE